MNLYLVTRTDDLGWDEFASMVIAGEDADEVRYVHPSCDRLISNGEKTFWKSEVGKWLDEDGYDTRDWQAPSLLKVVCIGQAADGIEKHQIIVFDFNAG